MRPALPLSLFWRTFFLLALLLAGGVFAWVQTLRALEFEPRAVAAAQQTASLVNLSRAALRQADGINRVAILKGMGAQQAVRVTPREPGDHWEAYEVDRFTQRVSSELRASLGPDAIVARSVNGKPGVWVGFSIDRDRYWLQAEQTAVGPLQSRTWFVWIGIAALATLIGSVAVASLINRPLKQLSFAASRIRGGDLDSRLDENTLTSEIREVNRGFNRMARELARVEEDRAVMLAGISHDLRTPLARLRLETEMSVGEEEARRNMASDIDQLDGIIDKFLEYARPGMASLSKAALAEVVEACAYPFRHADDIIVRVDVHPSLRVLADEVELARVLSNLLENARRYGKSPQTGVALVEIAARQRNAWVLIKVRDHGPGVAGEHLEQLGKPFFRAPGQSAAGHGLGLAIARRAVERHGGSLTLGNHPQGGFVATLTLPSQGAAQ